MNNHGSIQICVSRTNKRHAWKRALGNRGSRCARPAFRMHVPFLLNCSTLPVFRIFFFAADAAKALRPDVFGRSAVVSMSNSALAAVTAGGESAASEAKPVVSDSAFELTSTSGSLSASASRSAPGGKKHLSLAKAATPPR